MITARQTKGFTLIEAMIAMVILAVGLLAVAKFQSGLVSTSSVNKARAEAMSIAQTKLDEIRSYADEEELLDNLEPTAGHDASDNFTASLTGTAETTTTTGTNADYTVSWASTVDGTAANVAVTVSWTDPKTGSSDSVVLHSRVSWKSVESAAAAAIQTHGEVIPNPTGRARLGDGEYTDADTGLFDTSIDKDWKSNEDGTYEVRNGDEVDLVDLEGNVVLTLEEACNVNDGLLSSCTDFVKISGRVFTDDESSNSLASLDLNDIYVRASDAAFCAQDNDADNDPTNDKMVDSGEYRYFNYTCYLGGAWQGNIGLIQTQGGTQWDVCVGDPADAADPPEFAQRRVYRGMIHLVDSSGNAQDASGNITTEPLDYVYASVGIQDALQLPNEHDASKNLDDYIDLQGSGTSHVTDDNDTSVDVTDDAYIPGHNFMITNRTCSLALDVADTGALDITIATASSHSGADASGNLTINPFINSPDDFFCFNRVLDYDEYDASGNTTGTVNLKYYDDTDFRLTSNGGSYDIDVSNGCPFDPSSEINSKSEITGSIYVGADESHLTDLFVINTSDDDVSGIEGNCTVAWEASVDSSPGQIDSIGDPIGVLGHYTCKLYYFYGLDLSTAAPDDYTGGWTGNVFINVPSSTYCEGTPSIVHTFDTGTDPQLHANAGNHDTTVDSDYDFVCHANAEAVGDLQTVISLTSSDSTPLNGDSVTLQIVVTNNGPDDVTGVTLENINTAFTNMTLGTPVAGTGSYGSGTWTIGSLSDGASATLTLPMTITGSGGDRATASLAAPADADQLDYSTDGDVLDLELPITIAGEADVVTVFELTSGNPTPARGEEVTFTYTITNNGPATVTTMYVDYIISSAPSVLTNIETSEALQSGFGSYWWVTSDGDLLEGETRVLTLTAVIASDAAQGTYNWTPSPYTVAYTDSISVGDDLTASFTIQDPTSADLQTVFELTSGTSTPSVGDQVTYTLTVTNNGPAEATNLSNLELDAINDLTMSVSGALVLDSVTLGNNASVPGGPDDVAFANLSSGDYGQITITATVQDAAAGNTVTLTAPAVTASQTDPNTGNNSLNVDITVPVTTTNVLTLTGTITNYNNTAGGTVNLMNIYEADALYNVSASDGSCTIHSATSYTCTITITEGNTAGVVLELGSSTSNDDFCDYDSKIQSGKVQLTATNPTRFWLDGISSGGDATQNLTYAGNNDCP